jgi:predicted RNA-binding protein
VPSYWTLSGTLEKGVWGVSEKARALWAKVQPGDIVMFYAKRAGVIGRARKQNASKT